MKEIMKIRRFVVFVLSIILIAAIGIGAFMLMRHRQGQKQPQSQIQAQTSTTHPIIVPLDTTPQTESSKSTTELTTEPTTAPTTEPTPAPTTKPTVTDPPATNPPATVPPSNGGTCGWTHHFGEFTTILEPTTTSTGLQVAYCRDCGEEFIDKIPRLISSEKLENIDQRITIHKNIADSTVSYTYKDISVWDVRSWGGAPIMVITEGDSLDVIYFKQDGSKVEWSLEPFAGYHKTMIIHEDGSYRIALFGDFND